MVGQQSFAITVCVWDLPSDWLWRLMLLQKEFTKTWKKAVTQQSNVCVQFGTMVQIPSCWRYTSNGYNLWSVCMGLSATTTAAADASKPTTQPKHFWLNRSFTLIVTTSELGHLRFNYIATTIGKSFWRLDYWRLQEITGLYLRLLQITIEYWKLLEITADHCRLLTINWRLLEITAGYWKLLEITGYM